VVLDGPLSRARHDLRLLTRFGCLGTAAAFVLPWSPESLLLTGLGLGILPMLWVRLGYPPSITPYAVMPESGPRPPLRSIAGTVRTSSAKNFLVRLDEVIQSTLPADNRQIQVGYL
jgi:hypothetical protein